MSKQQQQQNNYVIKKKRELFKKIKNKGSFHIMS